MLAPWKKSYDQPRQHIKKQRHYFANKGPSSQGYGFSSGQVWVWELDCEEVWAPNNWCFWSVVLEKTLESPLDCKEIQPVHSEGSQPWDFFGRNDAKAEPEVRCTISCEELTHWKRLWCWEGLGAGGKGDDRGWDGWTASLTWRMWVWVNPGRWWWTGRPGVLRFMGSQRVGHDWATELNEWMNSLTFPKDAKNILWLVKRRCQLKGKAGADDWMDITGSTEHTFLKKWKIEGTNLAGIFSVFWETARRELFPA